MVVGLSPWRYPDSNPGTFAYVTKGTVKKWSSQESLSTDIVLGYKSDYIQRAAPFPCLLTWLNHFSRMLDIWHKRILQGAEESSLPHPTPTHPGCRPELLNP